MRIISTANEHDRALRATADAHERRFSALTERSPIPTLLSEQGMRLAHVNDAFCALVGLRAEQLLGTGWINTIHEDDLDGVIEQVAAALDGDEVETQARLVREDGSVRTTVIRFAHLFTPGVGAGFVGTIEDITDRLAFETKLAHQANHDPLTGLPNRTLLAQYVAGGSVPARAAWPASSWTSTTSRSSTTPSATPPATSCSSRWPTGCGRPSARATSSPGSAATSSSSCASRSTRRTPSGWPAASRRRSPADAPGWGRHPPVRQRRRHGADHRARAAEELIRDCDIAMYQAKAGGKGRVTVLDQQARAEARDKLRLIADLRDAIERDEITLYYQPIFGIDDREPVAVESLARWNHPDRGPISPAVFIPLAEESGLIMSLGLLVLEESCRQLAEGTTCWATPSSAGPMSTSPPCSSTTTCTTRWRQLWSATAWTRPGSPSRSPSRP